MTYSLDGRAAIITGASQGLGLAIARAYVRAGAHLYLCARNTELLEQARAEVAALAQPNQKVLAQACDVSNPDSVAQLVQEALNAFGQLQILVNNAGVYGPAGPIEENDWTAWTQAIAINVYGSVLMCKALLPQFRVQKYGKILQISGGGATYPLPRLSAYAASKAAIVRFAETLAEETRGTGIDVNAIAPGALNTRMLAEVLEAGPEKVGAEFHARMVKIKAQGGTPVGKGARLAVFLGGAASDGITGKLISAPWDPWENLPQHLTELNSDIYTLRRIVPKDRGLTWGDRT
jgi:NAD(P)-dependent dehydrogenase (short-subunit alcohol dehydrogenase family)